MAMAGTSDEGWRCLENGARSTASMPSSLANKKHPKFRSLMHCYLQKSQSPPLTLASASASASAIPNSELGFGKPALDCENAQNEEGFEMLYSDWTIMPGGGRRRGRPRRCSWEGEVNHAREIGNEFANRVQVKAEKSGIGAQKLEIRGEEGGIVAKKRAKLQNDNCKGPGGQTKMKALKMLNEEQNDRRKTSALERLACVKKKQSNCRISNQKRNHLSSGMQIMLSDDFFDVQKTSSEEHSAGQNSSDRDNREVVVNARENSSYGNNFATYSSIRCISIGRNKTQKRSNSTMQTISSFKKDGTNCFNGTDLESKVSSDGAAQRTGRTSHVEAQEKFETKGSFSSLTRKHQQNRVEKASQRLFSTNYHNVVDEETFPDRSQTISTKDCSLQDILKSAENDRSLPFQKRKKRKRSQLQLQNSCQKKVLDRLSYADSQSDNVWLEQGARFASNAGYVKNFSKSTAIHVNLEMEDRERDKDSRLWLQDEIQVDCPMSRITAFYDSAHLRHHGNTTASFQESENTGAKSIKLVGNILKSSTTSKTLKVARSKSQSLKLQMQRVMRKCAGLVHGTGTMSKTKTVARNPFKESAQRIANFLPRKPLQVKWREVYIGLMDPTILVSIRCKVYWPKDDEWYTGFISEYNQHTKKHRIIYDDEEEEWLLLLKERLALHISLHEKIALALGSKEQVRKGTKRKQGFEELAVLAASIEDFQGDYHHGDIVWSEIKGYPMWPAFVMDEEHALAFGLEPVSYARLLPVQFFGSHDCARINPRQVVIFSKGLVLNYHSKCKRVAFRQGLEEVERYLKDRKLPGSMTFLQEEVSGSITQQTKVKKQAEQTEDEDFMGDERQYKIKKSIKTLFTCPIVLGSLCVLSLGKIVKDSEYFHDHKYIWTEGYTAIRKFSSMKDPSKVVNYRMEILRSPVMRSLPVFHVTPDDGDVVEGSSASACWKRIFEKVSKAKCSSAASASGQTEKKRPVYKSGPAMFGFANAQVSRLIQALPSARACSKFMAWSEKVPCDETEELLPAGFKPVEVQWKHLDRCSVCYTNEEYEGNALRQCDKCRMLVHINCYGDLETPDGDLSLCKLCQPVAPKHSPPCCLCPIKGGAMKETTDGRWVHLACALWIPETCFVDTKRMEPVDGLRSINKERWKLICSICKVPYGVCIQCAEHHCRVAYHPLCARAAGLHTEVFTGSRRKQNGSAGGTDESFTPLRLLSYCKRHRQPREERNILEGTSRQAISVHCNDDELHNSQNSAGCARCEPYNTTARRGRREPEVHSAALAKRSFVENRPYIISGCRRNPYKSSILIDDSLLTSREQHDVECPDDFEKLVFSRHQNTAHASITVQEEVSQVVLSMSARFCKMRSTVHQRLTFGKSGIHGWGLFTKQPHAAGDMVIEYAGEIVRPVIADIREKNCYDSLVGAGTYMFCIDEERVIDATHSGSVAHLINHSCEPNCYSRVVAACGKDRIIIFAKRDIAEYEELTYDYRFTSIGEQLTCHCGCPRCRGIVNIMDDEDSGRILVPHSELSPWPLKSLEGIKSPGKERDMRNWNMECDSSKSFVKESQTEERIMKCNTMIGTPP